jgi:hypothetical protein
VQQFTALCRDGQLKHPTISEQYDGVVEANPCKGSCVKKKPAFTWRSKIFRTERYCFLITNWFECLVVVPAAIVDTFGRGILAVVNQGIYGVVLWCRFVIRSSLHGEHPEMGYRCVAPVSRCQNSPKVVGSSTTLLGFLSRVSPIWIWWQWARAIVGAAPIVFGPRTLVRTMGTLPISFRVGWSEDLTYFGARRGT